MRYLLSACCAVALAVGAVSAEMDSSKTKEKPAAKAGSGMKAKPKAKAKQVKKAAKKAEKAEKKEMKGEGKKSAKKKGDKKGKKNAYKKPVLKSHPGMNAPESDENASAPADGEDIMVGQEPMEGTPAETAPADMEDDLPPVD